MVKNFINGAILFCFVVTTIGPMSNIYADSQLGLPPAGTMVNLSPAYQPVIIKGLTVHKDNPFLFDFIVDKGQENLTGEPLKREGEKLIKYFLASLAIPDRDIWVNLSPYEKNRIIPKTLGQTDMGRDLLEQDYILKQITASLIYPEKDLGKIFWSKVYAKAQAMYRTSQVPVNTFNKVWIMADSAEVFEHNQTVLVVGSHLKVMLEEDYLSLTKHISVHKRVDSIGANMIRQIILPELEKEVNSGKNFANLRQIVNSLILANWYKKTLKQALLNQFYTNQSKVKGIDLKGFDAADRIYDQYLRAYKKGVFNYIKEDINAVNGESIPRKYFSGGFVESERFENYDVTTNPDAAMHALTPDRLVDMAAFATPHQQTAPIQFISHMHKDVKHDAAMLDIKALVSQYGPIVYQWGEGVAYFKNHRQFRGSQGNSTIGSMVFTNGSVHFGLGYLKNPWGLTMTDRINNSRSHTPDPEQEAITNSKAIRDTYLPYRSALIMSQQKYDPDQFDPLSYYDFSNNKGNPHHVTYFNGELQYPTGKDLGKEFHEDLSRPFYSLIQFQDGSIMFDYVTYRNSQEKMEEGYKHVIADAFVGNKKLPHDLVIFNGIPLITNGKRVELKEEIRAGMFQDLRHLFSLPPVKHPKNSKPGENALIDERISPDIVSGVYFGLEELSENNYAKAVRALDGPVQLSCRINTGTTQGPLNPEQIKSLLVGYKQVTDLVKTLKVGEYMFLPNEKKILIYLRPAPYPHLLVGETRERNIMIQSIGGNSGRIGITIEEAIEEAEKTGMRSLMTISQGTGPSMDHPSFGLLSGDESESVEDFSLGGFKPVVSPSQNMNRSAGSVVLTTFGVKPIGEDITKVEYNDAGGVIKISLISAGSGEADSYNPQGWPPQHLPYLIAELKRLTTEDWDKAMKVEAPDGGIDLTNLRRGMHWKINKEGQGIEMNIDPAMAANIKEHGIDGISLLVFRITPVKNFRFLKGWGTELK